MFCYSHRDLVARSDQGLNQRHRNRLRDALCSSGQRASANDHARSTCVASPDAFGDQGGIKPVGVRQKRLGRAIGQKATQMVLAVGPHQRINRWGEPWRRGDNGKGPAALPGLSRRRRPDAHNRHVIFGSQFFRTGITKGGNDNPPRIGQGRSRDLVSCGGQGCKVGDHSRCLGIRPPLDMRQMSPGNGEHGSGGLHRTVRVDQQNWFHIQRYPA